MFEKNTIKMYEIYIAKVSHVIITPKWKEIGEGKIGPDFIIIKKNKVYVFKYNNMNVLVEAIFAKT